jgi:hypothetical protein
MINKIKSFLFVIFVLIVCTAQSKRPEDSGRSEKSNQPASHVSVAQHAFNIHNNQAIPRAESVHASQVIHKASPQTHVAQPAHQERILPRVHAVVLSSPVENKRLFNRQHHKYWHPRYNFYDHLYHFYPYVNVVSAVELSPDCVQILFDGQMYYYDHWVFYLQEAGGYLAVPPPIGIIVISISPHAIQAIINGDVYYNHNDVYYKPVPQGYQVVEPLK